MSKEWEIQYDAALGDVFFHLSNYSITSGNQFTEETIPDNATLSDHRKSKQVQVSATAIFIGNGFQSRYDALKELENSDDTFDFYVRPKFEGGKREFVKNCGIETITKNVGNEENCIYCTISLKEIMKGSVAVSNTTYTPIPTKDTKTSNVKGETDKPSETEEEKAKETLTEEKYKFLYAQTNVDDYYDGGANFDSGDDYIDSGGLN